MEKETYKAAKLILERFDPEAKKPKVGSNLCTNFLENAPQRKTLYDIIIIDRMLNRHLLEHLQFQDLAKVIALQNCCFS